jgi:hypothetical protein
MGSGGLRILKGLTFRNTIVIGLVIAVVAVALNIIFFGEANNGAAGNPNQVQPQPGATITEGTLKVKETEVRYESKVTRKSELTGNQTLIIKITEDSRKPLSQQDILSLRAYFARLNNVSTSQISLQLQTVYYSFEEGGEAPIPGGNGAEYPTGPTTPEPMRLKLRDFLRVSDLKSGDYEVFLISQSTINVLLRGTYSEEDFTNEVLKLFPDWQDYTVKFTRSDL